jgi:hypothetical protein
LRKGAWWWRFRNDGGAYSPEKIARGKKGEEVERNGKHRPGLGFSLLQACTSDAMALHARMGSHMALSL